MGVCAVGRCLMRGLSGICSSGECGWCLCVYDGVACVCVMFVWCPCGVCGVLSLSLSGVYFDT